MVPNHARYQLRYTPKQLFYYNDLTGKCQELFPFFYVGLRMDHFSVVSLHEKPGCEKQIHSPVLIAYSPAPVTVTFFSSVSAGMR